MNFEGRTIKIMFRSGRSSTLVKVEKFFRYSDNLYYVKNAGGELFIPLTAVEWIEPLNA